MTSSLASETGANNPGLRLIKFNTTSGQVGSGTQEGGGLCSDGLCLDIGPGDILSQPHRGY